MLEKRIIKGKIKHHNELYKFAEETSNLSDEILCNYYVKSLSKLLILFNVMKFISKY
jgi:hypothetical protein